MSDVSKRLGLIENLLNILVSRIYPVIRYINVSGPTQQKSYLGKTVNVYRINVYTTIPSNIDMENYWTSEYADMDFGWMGDHYVDEILTYVGINREDFIREIFVYGDDDNFIGEF
jgi:hypothetical protein